MIRLFISLSYFTLAYYGFSAVKTVFRSKWLRLAYWAIMGGAYILLLLEVFTDPANIRYDTHKILVFSVFFAFYILALSLGGMMFLEDSFRWAKAGYKSMFTTPKRGVKAHLPARRSFVGKLALVLGAIPFGGLLYGIFEGRYNFKVLSYTLSFDDLPAAFDGYTITHFSDVHAGGLDDYDKVAYAVDLINKQASDLVIFTGDFVDRTATELEDWKSLFASVQAKDGKYSILGNHDYGDYMHWNDAAAQEKDLRHMEALQQEMGYTLLRDRNVALEKDGDQLMLIGSENWSAYVAKMRKGDFNKALAGVKPEDFKIVLSHDPSHWEKELIDHTMHFQLTLSGHTHGYQFGVEIPGVIKWTPFQHFSYKYWAGLYKEGGQYINVNRGFGYNGFPGRIGIWPEISVITLKKKHTS